MLSVFDSSSSFHHLQRNSWGWCSDQIGWEHICCGPACPSSFWLLTLCSPTSYMRDGTSSCSLPCSQQESPGGDLPWLSMGWVFMSCVQCCPNALSGLMLSVQIWMHTQTGKSGREKAIWFCHGEVLRISVVLCFITQKENVSTTQEIQRTSIEIRGWYWVVMRSEQGQSYLTLSPELTQGKRCSWSTWIHQSETRSFSIMLILQLENRMDW